MISAIVEPEPLDWIRTLRSCRPNLPREILAEGP